MTSQPPSARSSASPAGDPLDEFVCFSLYGAGLAMTRLYKPLLDPFGLTYPQYLALLALNGAADQTVGELGERLMLESNTLTPLLKRMEAAGLVSRKRDSLDERIVRASLTEQGRDIAERALACVPARIHEASGLSDEKIAELNRSLVMLRQALTTARS